MFVIGGWKKAFNNGNIERFDLFCTKSTFLWEYTFDDKLKNDWSEIGGWFKDPSSFWLVNV